MKGYYMSPEYKEWRERVKVLMVDQRVAESLARAEEILESFGYWWARDFWEEGAAPEEPVLRLKKEKELAGW